MPSFDSAHSKAPDHAHEHHAHAHAITDRRGAKKLALSLGLTLAIMVFEAVGGVLSGSLALLSDAGHMLTIPPALGLALLAVAFAAKPADLKRTFGYRRIEVLAAQVDVRASSGCRPG